MGDKVDKDDNYKRHLNWFRSKDTHGSMVSDKRFYSVESDTSTTSSNPKDRLKDLFNKKSKEDAYTPTEGGRGKRRRRVKKTKTSRRKQTRRKQTRRKQTRRKSTRRKQTRRKSTINKKSKRLSRRRRR